MDPDGANTPDAQGAGGVPAFGRNGGAGPPEPGAAGNALFK